MRLLLVSCLAICSAAASDVSQLNDGNFASTIKTGLWLVEFYAPWCWHCKALKPVWEQAATALKGKIKFGAVDAIASEPLRAEYGINGFPSIKLFKDGEFREDYEGARTVSGFTSYFESGASKMGKKPPSKVLSLNDASFKAAVANGIALVEFYAPWCGHCKALKPTWEKVANELGQYTVAEVDATAESELQSAYGVSSFPTIKLFKNGRLRSTFDGANTFEGIKAWAKKHENQKSIQDFAPHMVNSETVSFVLFTTSNHGDILAHYEQVAEDHVSEGKVAMLVSRQENKALWARYKITRPPALVCLNSGERIAMDDADFSVASIRAFVEANKKPLFYQVVPGKNFNEVMYADVLAATVHIDPSTHVSYNKMFKELALEMRHQFNFGSLDAITHLKLSEQVGIYKQDMPQLVVFDGKKLVYYSDRSLARTKAAIKAFLHSILAGEIPAKKPGDEKRDEPPRPVPPPPPESVPARSSNKLYDTEAGKHSGGGDVIKRLDKHEAMLAQLVKAQKQISASLTQIRDEIVDLRRDMEVVLEDSKS